MSDLTVMYITANLMPQMWVEYQLKTLRAAIGDTPIISISRRPMDLGRNIVEASPRRHWNIYVAMRTAADLATTKYVAMAEDDALYPAEHFTVFRPPDDMVSYNRSRWSLFSWDPLYCLRQRISNCTLIAPRKLLLDALNARIAKWPNGAPNELAGEVGREVVERRLGVPRVKMVEWYSKTPVVHLNHPDGIDPSQQTQWKAHGQIKAYDIPFWGKAVDIAGIYHGPAQGHS